MSLDSGAIGLLNFCTFIRPNLTAMPNRTTVCCSLLLLLYLILASGDRLDATPNPTQNIRTLAKTTVADVALRIPSVQEATQSKTDTIPTVQPLTFSEEIQDIDCAVGQLGKIELKLTGGVISDPETLQVEWIGPDIHLYTRWSSNQGVLDAIATAGIYTVRITQMNFLLFEKKITVSESDFEILHITDILTTGADCYTSLGTIELELAGGLPPYTIEWQQFQEYSQSNINTVSPSTSTETIITTTATPSFEVNNWVVLPQFQNNGIAAGVDPGIYRALIRDNTPDNSLCKTNIITQNIEVSKNSAILQEFKIITATGCEVVTTAAVQFSMQPNFNLDNTVTVFSLNGQTVSATQTQGRYQISNISAGNNALNVQFLTTTETTTIIQCEVVKLFEVRTRDAITYRGQTQFLIDECDTDNELKVDTMLVEGGNPYSVNGAITYDYRWEYSSFDSDPEKRNLFVGSRITNASPGYYQLTIVDQNNCESDPIVFRLASAFQDQGPIEVSGALSGLQSNSERVKSIAPSCAGENPDGRIGILIEGGLRPYTIKWYQESTAAENGFIPLAEFENATHLNDLSPGRYKVEIISQGINCRTADRLSSFVFHEEIITVAPTIGFKLISGPMIDMDLCQGQSGQLLVELSQLENELFAFYYQNELISVTNQTNTEKGKLYTLYIENPQETGALQIASSKGCNISVSVPLFPIEEPRFEYRSPSFEATQTILAREEVTFRNTSTGDYTHTEWIFGDHTVPLIVQRSALTPVRHTYGISGNYFVTARNYNSLGCSKEKTISIKIGKGYSVLSPTVFSPNKDNINDQYRVMFNGFLSVRFAVYDSFGNQLYLETVRETDPQNLTGIALNGWEGANAGHDEYFIFTFEGMLLDGETTVAQSGSFILLK